MVAQTHTQTHKQCIKIPTTIFKGPCIFSWAAKAFLNGVGVLGVWAIMDLRTLGVLKLNKKIWVYTKAQISLGSDWTEGVRTPLLGDFLSPEAMFLSFCIKIKV